MGGLLPAWGVSSTLAADKPAPTFLESGSNDLIRFQRGEVPAANAGAEETEAEAVPPAADKLLEDRAEADTAEDKKQEKRRSPLNSLGRLLFKPAPQDDASEPMESFASEPAPAPAPVPQAETSGLSTKAPANEGFSDLEVAPAARVAVPRPPQALSVPKVSSPASLDKDIDARLVTVCLTNPQEASGAKAFDIRRVGPPRYVADVGATACARFEPTRHTLYLWKTDGRGDLSLILSSRLDLNDADGTQVSVDWLRDR